MSRLSNNGKFGKYQYRVILDADTDCNYMERSIGTYFCTTKHEHKCVKCMECIVWINWNKADTKAKNICTCGEKNTIEIMTFDNKATMHIKIKGDN